MNTHLSIPSPVGNWRSSHRLADQLVRTGSQSTCPTHRHRYSKCKSLQNKQWPAWLYHNVHDFGYRQSVSRVHLATLTHVTIHQLPSKALSPGFLLQRKRDNVSLGSRLQVGHHLTSDEDSALFLQSVCIILPALAQQFSCVYYHHVDIWCLIPLKLLAFSKHNRLMLVFVLYA